MQIVTLTAHRMENHKKIPFEYPAQQLSLDDLDWIPREVVLLTLNRSLRSRCQVFAREGRTLPNDFVETLKAPGIVF